MAHQDVRAEVIGFRRTAGFAPAVLIASSQLIRGGQKSVSDGQCLQEESITEGCCCQAGLRPGLTSWAADS